MLSIVPTWVVIVLNFHTYKSIFGYFPFFVVVSLYCERVKAAFRSALSSGRICLFVSDSFSEWVVYCFNLVTDRKVQNSSCKKRSVLAVLFSEVFAFLQWLYTVFINILVLSSVSSPFELKLQFPLFIWAIFKLEALI